MNKKNFFHQGFYIEAVNISRGGKRYNWRVVRGVARDSYKRIYLFKNKASAINAIETKGGEL